MRWRRYPLIGLAFVVALFFAAITFAATTILIDEFTTTQTVCAGPSCTGNLTSVVSSTRGDILGNERDMQIGVSSGSGTITMTADLGYLSFKQDSGTGGPAEVVGELCWFERFIVHVCANNPTNGRKCDNLLSGKRFANVFP